MTTHPLIRRCSLVFILALLLPLGRPATPAFITTTVDNGGADDVGRGTSLVLTHASRPVISYYDATGGDLKLAVCNDATCTAPSITTIDDGGGDDVGWGSSLALNADGIPVVSYYDATNFTLKLAVCNDATCTAPSITTLDHAGGGVVSSSLALNAGGTPVISYPTNGDLKLAVCNDATCTASSITTVDDGGGSMVGRYNSLALNASGIPVISYSNDTHGDLKLAVCNDATCTVPSITTVDGAEDSVGPFNALALTSAGRPVISYYDYGNGDLKLAVCNDATCTAPSITTVDGAGDSVGASSALALTNVGHLVISYYDATGGDLKLAACNDTTCTAPNIITVDNGDGDDVGWGSSLALTHVGRPVISYYDATIGALKLATTVPTPENAQWDNSGDIAQADAPAT